MRRGNGKAPRTQADNRRELDNLERAFGHMAPDRIDPSHVRMYRDARGRQSKVRANRERALLAHVFSEACEWGYCRANPVREVSRFTERPRDRYVEDHELAAWCAWAPPVAALTALFIYRTGLRPSDPFRILKTALTPAGIEVLAAKTRRRALVQWTPRLREVVNGLLALPRPATSLYLISSRYGQPYTLSGFQSLWQRYMRRAIDEGALEARFTIADLRAKHATDAEAEGKSATANLLHDDARTTTAYLRSRKRMLILPVERSLPTVPARRFDVALPRS